MSSSNKANYRNKVFTYKCVKWNNSGENLQSRLTQSLAIRTAWQRAKEITVGGESRRLINSFTPNHKGMLCGNLLEFTPGNDQQTIQIDEQAQVLQMEAIQPPQKSGKQKEFIESIMFFAVSGNHIVLAQTNALRAKHFEEYANWLIFGSHGNPVIGTTTDFCALCDPQPIDFHGRDIHGVKSVIMRAPVRFENSNIEDSKKEPKANPKRKPVGNGWHALLEMFKNSANPFLGSTSLEDAISSGPLEIKLELNYKGRHGSEEDAHDLIDKVANTFRHLDDLDFQINLSNGGTIVGSEKFKVSQPHAVSCIGGYPDTSGLYTKMGVWLAELINAGKINPGP